MPAVRRFKTQDNCRQAIAWVFRELEADRIKPEKARVMIYAALSVSGILEVVAESHFEERIAALESRFGCPPLQRPA